MQDESQRESSLSVLAWFGIATAAIGVLVGAGVLPLYGGTDDGRLQFSFQYANAAAAWFGVVTLLCVLSPRERLRSFAALPTTALLLTQSGGASLVFVVVAMVIGVFWARTGAWSRLFESLLQVVLALALFLATSLVGGVVAVLALVVIVFCDLKVPLLEEALVRRIDPRRGSTVLALVIATSAVMLVVLFGPRVVAALSSLTERTYHIRDGLTLWASSPLVGIGPNNWQYLYQYVQTASYYTAVVHSSLVQLLVDAGLLGLCCFATACVVGLRRQLFALREDHGRSSWVHAELMATAFILVHSVVEFDLQFSSLAFLLAFLLATPDGQSLGVRSTKIRGFGVGIVSAVVLLPICSIGLVCALASNAIEAASANEDYDVCVSLYANNPLARMDVGAQQHYLEARYGQRDYQEVVDTYTQTSAHTDRAAYYAVLSYYALGMQQQATTALIERLESQPYNVDFYRSAQQLVVAYGSDPSQTARLNAVMDAVARNTEQSGIGN